MDGHYKEGILVCEVYGESMVLNGPLSVWPWGTTSFGCECGEQPTLADRLDHRGFGEATGTAKSSPPASPPLP